MSEWLALGGWELDEAYAASANVSATFPGFTTTLCDALLGALFDAKYVGGAAALDPPPSAALGVVRTHDDVLADNLTLPATTVPSLLFQSKAMHGLPTLLNSLYDARVRQATGGARGLAMSVHPLPRTKEDQLYLGIAISAFASILILVPFAFVGASFVTPLVRERETGSKSMQFVSGVRSFAYWAESWLWDVALYGLVLLASLAVFLLMQRDEFTGTAEKFGATTLLLGLFGTACIGVASAASFAFRTPSAALLVMTAFHFLTGFVLVIVDVIFQIVGGASEDANKHLSDYLYPVFPAYCLGHGFIVLTTRDALSQLPSKAAGFVKAAPLYSWGQLGSPLTFLFIETIVGLVVTLLLQAATSHPHLVARALDSLTCGALRGVLGGDAGGAATATTATPPSWPSWPPSRTRPSPPSASRSTLCSARTATAAPRLMAAAEGGGAAGGAAGGAPPAGGAAPMLVLEHLRKQYGGAGGKLAVRDLCLRVYAGECFGLLGVNGAGKSTTFGMLTGAVSPSSGDARLSGLSILSDQDALRQLVGFCPQHDALEAKLTPRETLRLYARIKGLPRREIEGEIDGLLRDLDLHMFASKQAGTLSGGNKRKLCVGIALIGAPRLVLLDEPSSGMDAASKRFLWAVIKRRTASCCTILTTHSMEECEALCGRIGVMVDGAMRCLGPIPSLKSRYGQGYKLDLRLDASRPMVDPSEIARLVAEGCPGAKVEESEPPCMTLTIPQHGGVALADIFAHLDGVRARCHVLECSLSQCTLEQIFLVMASKKELREQGGA